MRLAVLVSGSGTLLEAFIEAGLPIELVVADRPCRALDLVDAAMAKPVLLERTDFGPGFDRDSYATDLLYLLEQNEIDIVAMAGFGTILGEPIFAGMPGRILNTHPALLPSFPGWHAVREALAHGVKVSGCTIHIATPTVDSGPILAQEAVVIAADDDEVSLHDRIKIVERRLYVETLLTIHERGRVLEQVR